MTTRVVVEEFDWHHSIARNPKPPVWCKNIGDISYASRVIAYFCLQILLNFVAKATRVGCGTIWRTSFNCPTLKTPVRCNDLEDISYASRGIAYFVFKFRYHGNKGRSGVNLNAYASRVIAYFCLQILLNFVAKATRVGCGTIWRTSINCPTLKSPC